MGRDRRVVVVGGGPLTGVPLAAARSLAAAAELVIAADSGLDRARALGLRVDVVVGDFDSVSAAALEDLDPAAELEHHPADKDLTDLELALDRALAAGASHVDVIAGRGGRLDHDLAVWLVIASPRYVAAEVTARTGTDLVSVVVPGRPRELTGAPGDVVSLLPVHGDAEGVETHGLAYPLRRELLVRGSGRGVSNVFLGVSATVSLAAGTLLAVQPGPEDRSGQGAGAA